MRAVGFLNAAPQVDGEFHGEIVREILQAARQVEAPTMRAQLLAAALPLLDLTERAEVGAELAVEAERQHFRCLVEDQYSGGSSGGAG